MQLGHAALKCSLAMEPTDMQHLQAAWTGSMDMQHGQATWTCSIAIQHMEMQHGDVDMQHCINMNMQQGH
jgi:hypothetical protein